MKIFVEALFRDPRMSNVYFRGFKHCYFVDLMWRLGARVGLRSAHAISEESLGKVDQAHGEPFWGVLDRHKYIRASILMTKHN